MAAASCTLSLKWNKQKFDVQIDPSAPVAALKDSIRKLTGGILICIFFVCFYLYDND